MCQLISRTKYQFPISSSFLKAWRMMMTSKKGLEVISSSMVVFHSKWRQPRTSKNNFICILINPKIFMGTLKSTVLKRMSVWDRRCGKVTPSVVIFKNYCQYKQSKLIRPNTFKLSF